MEKTISTMHLIFLVVLPLARALRVEIIEHKDRTLVPGIHLEQVNEILYDAYITLIYQVPFPPSSPSELSVPIYLSNYFHNCSNDNWIDSWGQFQCPVSFHMKRIVERVSQEINTQEDYSRSTYGDFVADISCSTVQKHFKETYVLSQAEWTQYINQLSECKVGKIFIENVALSVNSSTYGDMLKNFLNVYVPKNSYSSYSKMPGIINAFGVFQTSLLVEHLLLTSKREGAHSTCKRGVVPSGVITKEQLQSSILNIQHFMTSKNIGYKLSIQNDSRLVNYMNLPLTDCTILENDSLIVSIQIPVRKESFSGENSFKIKTVPFLRKINSSLNSLETFEICEYNNRVLGDLKKFRLISKPNNDFVQASCAFNSPLCQIQNSVKNQCLLNILVNNTEYATKECPMTCTTINKTSDLPYFRRVSSDTWIILEDRTNQDIFVNCDSKPVKMISGLREAGTLQVTLPCDCQLLHRGRSLNSSKPCGRSLIVKEITPHFFNKVFDKPSVEEPQNNEAESNASFVVEKTENNSSPYPSLSTLLSIITGMLSCVAIAIGIFVLKKVQLIDYQFKLRLGENLIRMDL